jgi:hypothetical protein
MPRLTATNSWACAALIHILPTTGAGETSSAGSVELTTPQHLGGPWREAAIHRIAIE